MDGLNLIMLISIILFARLGIRLYTRYKKIKSEEKDD